MNINTQPTKESWKQGSDASFLQSWEYGEFLSSIGRDIVRFQVEKEGNLFTNIQAIKSTFAGHIAYLYIPHIKIKEREDLTTFLEQAKKDSYAFVRIEPCDEISTKNFTANHTQNLQPQHTLTLDLRKIEEELLADMYKKTRYNIRLAEKKGVEIRKEKNVGIYWNLHTETTRRQKFVTHSKNYIHSLLKTDMTEQYTAYLEDEPLASAIILRSGHTATYFFGASADKHRKVMAPYLLHWKIVQNAKKDGCTSYDFWGFAPPAEEGSESAQCFHTHCWQKNHYLSGVSRFKAGFGGSVTSHPNAQDIVLNPLKYNLYRGYTLLRGKRKVVGHGS